MPNTKVPQNIKPEGYWRAIGAYFIDFALTVLTIVILFYSVGNTLILKYDGHQNDVVLIDNYCRDSGLISVDESTHKQSYYAIEDETGKTPAYQQYVDKVWNYFTVLCLPENSQYSLNPEGIVSFDGEHDYVPFSGERTVENVGKWVYEHYFNSTLWKAPEKTGSTDPDYSKAPIPAEDPTGREAKLKSAMCDLSGTPKGVYVYAVSHALAQPNYKNYTNAKNLHYWMGWMPWFALAPLIFFFIIPVASRNGRTIGKRIIGTAVLGNDGYTARKVNIVLHCAFPTFYWFMLMLPFQSITFPLFLLVLLLDFMTLVMTNNHQSIHDKISMTIVVDAKRSTWFASKEDEADYLASHPNSYVAKLRREEERANDPHLAAVNAAIIAEDSIVDLSTIGRARKEASAMTSFDEFEQKSDEDYARRESELRDKKDE